MVRFLLVGLLAVPAAAQDAKKPFGNKSFGEGGGYTHPDPQVGEFFEKTPAHHDDIAPSKPDAPQLPPADAPAKVSAPTGPAELRPGRARPRPFDTAVRKTTPVSAAAEAAAPAAAKAPALASSSLGYGKLRPLPATDASADSASDDARRDYETKLLGAAEEPKRDALGAASPTAHGELAGAAAAPTEGALFVSLELDPREAGSLRDAVAGLGAAASFRPDARFDPMPAGGGAFRVSGWIPASRLGDAISRPGVKRVSVEPGQRPSTAAAVEGEYLVGLRVADAAHPEESVTAGVKDLTAKAGFKLRRVLGVETAPDGASVAVVSGSIPVSRLSDAMGRPGVVKVAAAIMEFESAPESAPKSAASGFAKFVYDRGLWLALLTLVLLLPSLAGALKDGLAVFVPYR